jgi:hypothetical protein
MSTVSGGGHKVWGNNDTHGHDERVGQARHRISELVTELDPVLIQPATRDHCDSVKAGDACLSEEGGQDVASDTTDSVSREDLEINASHKYREHDK